MPAVTLPKLTGWEVRPAQVLGDSSNIATEASVGAQHAAPAVALPTTNGNRPLRATSPVCLSNVTSAAYRLILTEQVSVSQLLTATPAFSVVPLVSAVPLVSVAPLALVVPPASAAHSAWHPS